MNSKKAESKIAVVGMGVMGRNLALNIEEHGYPVAVWNRTTEKARRFVGENPGKRFAMAETPEELVGILERPRRIMLMVQAGAGTDAVIEQFAPLLSEGDVLIDGGNSWFKDTQRRSQRLTSLGVSYLGVGVSGGEEGARHGPAIMPGGPREAYQHVREIFESIAARTESGPCVGYVGPDGAGHFVKMVHNGIEYADMQLIAEAYDILRRFGRMQAPELALLFDRWNQGPLGSFLIELTATVLNVRDAETGTPLVDLIADKAAQKGTGIWTQQAALELGIPVPTIGAAVNARVLSSMQEERLRAGGKLSGPKIGSAADAGELAAAIHDALLGARICSYAQGMSLIRSASQQWQWQVNLAQVARIWKGGCIIRARLLDSLMNAFERSPGLENVLLDDELGGQVVAMQQAMRRTLHIAQQHGIPAPGMSASLAYFDSYRTGRLPQNLTQAQRDAFGAHTYERIDRPEAGALHTDWLQAASHAGR